MAKQKCSLCFHVYVGLSVCICCALSVLGTPVTVTVRKPGNFSAPVKQNQGAPVKQNQGAPVKQNQGMVVRTFMDSTDGWSFCFEDKCRCKDDVADCSNNHGNLSFIPVLPPNVTSLNFSFNRVSNITDDFFNNVTRIRDVNLDYNDLAGISPVAFRRLGNLTKLSVAHNARLSYVTLEPVFAMRNLLHLDIGFCNLGLPVPDNFFHRDPPPHWQELVMRGNNLASLSGLDLFTSFKQLTRLDLSDTNMPFVAHSVVDNIDTLVFQHNGLTDFPSTCDDNGTTLFPRLTHLDLKSNQLSTVVAGNVCLPVLQFLDLSENGNGPLSTFTVPSNAFPATVFPSLKELNVETKTKLYYLVSFAAYAFNSSTLETLSVATGESPQAVFDDDMLAGCPNLHSVVLDKVAVHSANEKLGRILQPVPNLKHLSARFNRLGLKDLFCDQHYQYFWCQHGSLVSLNVAGNTFLCIPDGIFDCLTNLTDLDLSANSLDGRSSPHEATFSQATQDRLRLLDLSANPYLCDCSYRWLYLWRQRDPDLFSSSTNYSCSGFDPFRGAGDSPPVLSAQACLFEESWTYIWILIGAVNAYEMLFVALYLLRRRFRVRQMLKRALVGDRVNREQQQQGGNVRYHYDLFVSYAEEDGEWVRRYLMPELEERRGLRLCLHQRDFHPGRQIVESIEESVSVSRQVGELIIH
jgi:Leucine-rich repeat (LRR) protein